MFIIGFVGRNRNRKSVKSDMHTVQSNYNFIDKFISAVNLYPDNIAYEIEGTGIKYTYGECCKKMEIWKGYFETLNLKKGDKVFILLAEEIEFILSFYALTSIGVISAFYDVKATDYELNQVFAELDPVGIITSSEYFAKRENFIENKNLRFILLTNDIEGENNNFSNSKMITTSSFTQDPKKLIPPNSDTIISCHFTYKGFGYPLQVRHKYNDYSMFLEQSSKMYPQEPGSVHLICLPYYPIYGISSSVLFPLSCGCKMLICTNFYKHGILNLLELYKISLVCLVPLILKKLAHEAALVKENIRNRLNPALVIISGGSYLEESIQDKIYELLEHKVYQGYGLTETFPITFNHKNKVRFGTVGAANEGYTDIVILDNDGKQLPNGTVGEIVIKGKTLADGYYGRQSETEKLFKDGYFYTGDIGFLDEENFLHFIGRRYPFTKVASRMVDLTEIENVVKKHTGVIDARAIVRENKKFGEIIHLHVKVNENIQITEKDIKSTCKNYFSKHKIPSKIKISK